MEEFPLPIKSRVWQLIYLEATRGNHLLFHKLIQNGLELKHPHAYDETMLHKIGLVWVTLLTCSDLKGMLKVVGELCHDELLVLFLLYRRQMEAWRLELKRSLH